MVRLKNIVRNGDAVTCDIIPEDSKAAGTLTVDLLKEDIAGYTLPPGYESCFCHVRHACRAIIQDVKAGNLPRERLVMWY